MPAITEFDLFFLSYDEPNAEKHWADLVGKAPWAERVHGVKGFDAVHRTAAERSTTDWFVTVDADNMVDPTFFDQKIEPDHPLRTYSWNGVNALNGLIYGNGGLKLWSKRFALDMNTHERADDPRKAVDFCWEDHYSHLPGGFSEVWPNGSPTQAYRAGFREGVKLTLDRGRRVKARDMVVTLHPQNLRNLRVWCGVGADRPNGLYAMLGAREGWLAMCDPDWDHTVVRDFDWFRDLMTRKFRSTPDEGDEALLRIVEARGRDIELRTGIAAPVMDMRQSEFFREAMRLRNG